MAGTCDPTSAGQERLGTESFFFYSSLCVNRRGRGIRCQGCGVRLELGSNQWEDAALASDLCFCWPIFGGWVLSVLVRSCLVGVAGTRFPDLPPPPPPFFLSSVKYLYIYCIYQFPPGGRWGHTECMSSLAFLAACKPGFNSQECYKTIDIKL